MIFTEDSVKNTKRETGSEVFGKLQKDVGTTLVLGAGAIVAAASGTLPLAAIASIGLAGKIPAVLRGVKFVKNDVETFIPEYRALLKDKKMKPFYEEQFKKLAVDYIESASTSLEKRFRGEFIAEWLHSSQVYSFELKKSGFAEYSQNLKTRLVIEGDYKDRPNPTVEIDTGVTFGGYCEDDRKSEIQRKVFEDFKGEGIVGNLIIRGANAAHLESLLALQDFVLTEADKSVLNKFFNMSPEDYIKGYKDEKFSGVYFTSRSSDLVTSQLNIQSRDSLDIAGSVLAIGYKVREIEGYMKANNIKLSESPVTTHEGFDIDLDILSENYQSLAAQFSQKSPKM